MRSYIQFLSHKSFLPRLSFCLIIPLAFFTFQSANTFAASTLTLTIDNNNLSADVANHYSNGTFAKSSNSIISVTTNNYTGYTLSIKTTDSTDLVGDNESVISSIDSPVSETNFAGTTSESSIYNGKWGYLPSKINSADNTNYLPAPSLTGDIIDSTSSANSTANTYTLSFGVRVGTETPPGIYSGTFMIYAVANLIPYKVTFHANAPSNEVANMPSPSVITGETATGFTITAPLTAPTRENFAFGGWCILIGEQYDQQEDGVINSADPDSICYSILSPNQSIQISIANGSNNYSLYPIWEQNLYHKIAYMSKGTQTESDLYEPITTENSGVYEYNENEFGALMDEDHPFKTYYYRGILDSENTSSQSDPSGNADLYPNYVVLKRGSELHMRCFRIVRTTSSGGIKLIDSGHDYRHSPGCMYYDQPSDLISVYNGNSQESWSYRTAASVGYYFNRSHMSTSTQRVPLSQLYSSYNSSFTGQGSTAAGKANYQILTTYGENIIVSPFLIDQQNSEYCNDRTLYRTTSGQDTILPGNYVIPISGGDGSEYHFGAYERNASTLQLPSLICPDGQNVAEATTLNIKTGLITADEATFAGSGPASDPNGSTAYQNSFLNAGHNFWTMSPHSIAANGNARMFYINANGALANSHVAYADYYIRPVITIVNNTYIYSGTGTKEDPWLLVVQ